MSRRGDEPGLDDSIVESRRRVFGEHIEAILDNSPAAIFVKDLRGRYVMASRAVGEMVGLRPGLLLGRTDAELWPDMAPALERNDREVLERGEAVERDEQVRTGDRVRIFRSTKFPLRDRSGQVTAVAGIAYEVTEQRRAMEQVREGVARRDEFLAMLSHELRNPVHAARAALTVAMEDRAAGTQALQVIARQLDHLGRIMEDLLEVSRASTGRISFQSRIVDLNLAVRHGAEVTSPLAADHGVRVEVTTPDRPLPVLGDAARLSQMVANLISNGVRFSDRGQAVSVRLLADGDSACLEVADHGIGLAEEDRVRLFEPFYQADRSLDRARGGLGLGLALVKAIVDHHGGDIEASGAVGRGATFRIRLPLHQSVREEERPRTPTPLLGLEETPLRVFLVEDNEDTRVMVRSFLERRGYEVLEAATGEEGLAAIRREKPHVALVDVGLPGIDGYELARRLRDDPDTCAMKLVAVTGYGRAEDRRKAEQAGFDRHLTKPVAPREMEAVLREVGSLAFRTPTSDPRGPGAPR